MTSTLQGLALNPPPPLAKPADSTLPLRYENVLVPGGAAGARADQIAVDIGRLASIVYVRDIAGPEPRVLRGSLGVGLAPGESAALPEHGVTANINFATINVDAWEAVLGRLAGPGGAPAPAAPAAAAGAASGYLPNVIAVRARELTVEGRTLHDVVVGGSREGPVWRASVDARELNGFVEYRQPTGAGAGRLHARRGPRQPPPRSRACWTSSRTSCRRWTSSSTTSS